MSHPHPDDQLLPDVPPAAPVRPRLVTSDDSEFAGGARALQLALAEAMRRPVGLTPRQRAVRALARLAVLIAALAAVGLALGLPAPR